MSKDLRHSRNLVTPCRCLEVEGEKKKKREIKREKGSEEGERERGLWGKS